MKSIADLLLSQTKTSEIVMGNTALVRAFVEAGTRVITSYPGSPTPEIAEAIAAIPLEQRPFYFEFSTNEKVATEVAFGAAINGHLSTVFFKSVGLNVASDTFVQLNHMEIIGGMVIVLGNDPGINSSQNEQDNRHFAHLSYTPWFEPASASEVYSMYLEAAMLARQKRMAVIVALTTHVCHQKEKVTFNSWMPHPPDNTPAFNPKNGPYIPITSLVFPMKAKALKKLDEVADFAERSDLNRIIDNNNHDKGVIVSGLAYLSLCDTLEQVSEKPDILKIGTVHPLPKKKIRDFISSHTDVKIIEELDNIIEKEVKTIAFDERITTRIRGKIDQEDWIGEYTPAVVFSIIQKTWPLILPQKKSAPAIVTAPVPKRPAQLCPGCGHRSAFFAIKKAITDQTITVADIGCHTLGYLPPMQIGQVLLCMGASCGISAGL
ncbi:MAG: hypothetical protein JW795_11525, partial [Chitinivibrionales bacterium]|nr:hypothetical protein [Chitinivibrionales bacterium]